MAFFGKKTQRLCHLNEIENGQGKGFTLKDGQEIFVLREGRKLFGYVNSCPHIGVPLDFQPDRFLNADSSYIICSTHGALFEIETGDCIAGPCAGKALKPIAVSLDEDDGVVLIPA